MQNAETGDATTFAFGEAVKIAILHRASAAEADIAIGATRPGWSDCAALTAARIFREMTKVTVDAGQLTQRWALPGAAFDFKVAKAYALNYFKRIGIELSAKASDITNPRTLEEGSYAVFFRGGPTGGHVLYGSVTKEGMQLIDEQSGKVFTNLVSAQNGLGMQFGGAYRVLSAIDPLEGALK
jgi:hypothetical protein